MITYTYKINQTLTGRPASLLSWDLNAIPCNVRVINSEGRMINGKSLIGLLSGKFKVGDKVEFVIDDLTQEKNFKKILNKFGTEVRGGV